MEKSELASWVLGVHGTIFTISLLAFYRFSDRTQLFEKTMGDLETMLARMRQRIRNALEERLSPVFEQSRTEPTILLNPIAYTERAQNPVGTESFREALSDFLRDKCEFLAHYREVLRARNRWAFWARGMSWIALMLLIYEILCLTYLGLFGKLLERDVPQWAMKWSFAPVGGLVAAFFLCWITCLIQHDRIHEHKTRYPSL